MEWDLYCRVVDNLGDIGVCWRLAADLAARGECVTLRVDDASALTWMAPAGAAGVQVEPWPAEHAPAEVGQVVVAAFGCELPASVLSAMAGAAAPPLWINLEYLSAEDYVERSHGLPSLQAHGPGAGLTQWFFYPGYTGATGGLLREPGQAQRQRAFDSVAWLAARGLQRRAGERIVSLFCYEPQPALGAMLDALGEVPTLLLATPVPASRLLREHGRVDLKPGRLRAVALPWLSQADYDRLLWSCDLNFVRGEDSWLRAQWAGRPFVWQAYAQSDLAHAAKLAAFLDRFLAGAPAAVAAQVGTLMARWNGLTDAPITWPDDVAWRAHCRHWRDGLTNQPDLVSRLLGFVAERR